MKAVVAAFNQEKALVGAFSVITNLRMEVFEALVDIDCVPQDIIDLTLKKMDVDKDGRICFDDYEETVKNEPLLLEAFGPCLPKATTLDLFMRQVLKRPDGISTLKNYYLGLT